MLATTTNSLCLFQHNSKPSLGGSGCWPGSLSLTQRRKDAKGKCRDLSQRLQQARSTTGSLVLPSASHQRPSAVWLCGILLCELGALARNPLSGSGCWPGILESHAKAQRRKGKVPESLARSTTSKIHYRQLGSSISVPSASISGPVLRSCSAVRFCGPVLRSGSAVRFCGLLLGELGALARNPLSGSDCCRGSLSLTQRRKDAKGKCRNL